MRPKTIWIVLLVIFIASLYVVYTYKLAEPSEAEELVFLLHGLGRSKSSMWLLASRLKEAGFDVKRIGYKSINRSPEEILIDVSEQIISDMPGDGRTVHFVGHSLGGLMIRAYLEDNNVDNLGRVVLIGTPNKGTPLVDRYRDTWWMKMLGPMTLALGTEEESFPNSIADPYYPVGIIAGESEVINNEKILPGKDDGVVPLESTKLNSMSDIVVIKRSHNTMRYDRDIAEQTIEFLKKGRFKTG